MDDALGRGTYIRPCVVDYGDLFALTSAMHLIYGSAFDSSTRDLSFSSTTGTHGGGSPSGTSPVSASGATTPTAQTPDVSTVAGTTVGGGQTPAGTTTSGAGGTVGTAGGGGGAGGGTGVGPSGDSLPFTGYPAAVVAAIGSGLVAAGASLRRAARRRR